MTDLENYYGPNAGYVLDLYDRYQLDPNSVDEDTQKFFKTWNPSLPSSNGSKPSYYAPPAPAFDVTKVVLAARVARLVREQGHKTAQIDPLGSPPPGDPGLELSTYGLEESDLAALPAAVVGGPLAEGAANALEALERLRRVYSGSIGYEDDQVQSDEERKWLVDAIESRRFIEPLDAAAKKDLLQRLTEVETFERFLDRVTERQKRFSIEGTDMTVSMLDTIIHLAAETSTREVVVGMAHRGRLNVLAHILGKPYAEILFEFLGAKQGDETSTSNAVTSGWSGDVKYHMGARKVYTENGVMEMPITLAPNPSHLEFVDPVVIGRARAAQEVRSQPGPPVQDPRASIAILIHGDAAFPGQGIVAETLNMSQLRGYDVGGTIHIITNNQIGFTTDPIDSRSTLYASDLAKGFEIPIVHVNADDPEACIAVSKMAHAYQDTFGKDFLIDLVGYRRWGHNEADEPSYTQPLLYDLVSKHPTVREIYAKQLEGEGVVTAEEATAMVATVEARLEQSRAARTGRGLQKGSYNLEPVNPTIDTRVPEEDLAVLNESLLERPEGFSPNDKLERVMFAKRRTALNEPNAIIWSHAEALAFASILSDGIPIRLSGQDAERGTFGTRHLVLHDVTNGDRFNPMQTLPQARASFAVYNSPLSENSCLGFEYGYSMHAAKTLVLWEAQFGDFANGAQVIIDQFIVSGNAKWRQTPSLVLLLPHGYEGQGPEHSSARLERFLQLAADENIRVVNCTEASQYFHVLRRQALLLQKSPRPLIVMSPKSLLRNPINASSLAELTGGRFRPIIDDPEAGKKQSQVTRIVLCSGKVYYDTVKNPAYAEASSVALVRVEELYPFPHREVQELIASYPEATQVVWLQEEPANMGAWSYVEPILHEIAGPGFTITYCGRRASASPAEGSGKRHVVEQNRIIAEALSGIPVAKGRRSKVTNAR